MFHYLARLSRYIRTSFWPSHERKNFSRRSTHILRVSDLYIFLSSLKRTFSKSIALSRSTRFCYKSLMKSANYVNGGNGQCFLRRPRPDCSQGMPNKCWNGRRIFCQIKEIYSKGVNLHSNVFHNIWQQLPGPLPPPLPRTPLSLPSSPGLLLSLPPPLLISHLTSVHKYTHTQGQQWLSIVDDIVRFVLNNLKICSKWKNTWVS